MEKSYICTLKKNVIKLDKAMHIPDGEASAAVMSKSRILLFYNDGLNEYASQLLELGAKFKPAKYFGRELFSKLVQIEIKNSSFEVVDVRNELQDGSFLAECFEGRVELSLIEDEE